MKWACGLLEDEVAPDPETAMEVRDNLLELYAWNLYFILYSTYAEWQEGLEALEDDVGVAALRESGQRLLASLLGFLSPTSTGLSCVLDLVTCSGPSTQELGFMMLACSGDRDDSYQPWAVGDAEHLSQQLQRTITAMISPSEAATFGIKVVAAPTEEGSFIQLEAQAGTPAALERATGLLALAVKGCLAEPTSPLQGVNLAGAATSQVQMCKAVVIPAAMLKAATLRQWLVENGEELEVGSGLLPLLAGEGGAMGYQGLSPHFAPAELAAFLELERKTRSCRYPEISELEVAHLA